jgi:hypothetical protein
MSAFQSDSSYGNSDASQWSNPAIPRAFGVGRASYAPSLTPSVPVRPSPSNYSAAPAAPSVAPPDYNSARNLNWQASAQKSLTDKALTWWQQQQSQMAPAAPSMAAGPVPINQPGYFNSGAMPPAPTSTSTPTAQLPASYFNSGGMPPSPQSPANPFQQMSSSFANSPSTSPQGVPIPPSVNNSAPPQGSPTSSAVPLGGQQQFAPTTAGSIMGLPVQITNPQMAYFARQATAEAAQAKFGMNNVYDTGATLDQNRSEFIGHRVRELAMAAYSRSSPETQSDRDRIGQLAGDRINNVDTGYADSQRASSAQSDQRFQDQLEVERNAIQAPIDTAQVRADGQVNAAQISANQKAAAQSSAQQTAEDHFNRLMQFRQSDQADAQTKASMDQYIKVIGSAADGIMKGIGKPPPSYAEISAKPDDPQWTPAQLAAVKAYDAADQKATAKIDKLYSPLYKKFNVPIGDDTNGANTSPDQAPSNPPPAGAVKSGTLNGQRVHQLADGSIVDDSGKPIQ